MHACVRVPDLSHILGLLLWDLSKSVPLSLKLQLSLPAGIECKLTAI